MPGIIIAGTHSGCGKTTITLGIMAALKKKGFTVQPFKTGPDFIDAGLHRLVTGRPSINLDIWMCGKDYVRNCFCRYSSDADISIIEGVMGFYDGELNTASLAEVLNLPVILVVDAYGMAESAGAIVKGFMEYKNQGLIKGVIFNRVASERHFKRLKNSVQGVGVFGYLPRDIKFEIPHRHLGLVVAEEHPITSEAIERLADSVLEHVDMEIIEQHSSRTKIGFTPSPLHPFTPSPIIAVAYDKAFCFYYEDNLDLLREPGAEIVRFSPLYDETIPEADAIYIGGGYPELHALGLSKNISMLRAVQDWANSGRPIYAECGGLMYLSRGIYDTNGDFFQMAGVMPFEAVMRRERFHLGYREVELKEDCILGKKGDRLKGHEFHYSDIKELQKIEDSRGRGSKAVQGYSKGIYSVINSQGESIETPCYRFKNTFASYIHIHFGSSPAIAGNFINFIRSINGKYNTHRTWKS
ncbi:MAG: cobyrinate a,c-diamide synthase [Thermodesulfovibrionales bacterium]